MQWGSGGIDQLATKFAASKADTILGFNEPDHPQQVRTLTYLSLSPVSWTPFVTLVKPNTCKCCNLYVDPRIKDIPRANLLYSVETIYPTYQGPQ